ncbi:hypothetical protein IF2G_07656 [Cordyceps javanica]|nr:hypothetical protein IF2G_07656 [Cordyceps javanica]
MPGPTKYEKRAIWQDGICPRPWLSSRGLQSGTYHFICSLPLRVQSPTSGRIKYGDYCRYDNLTFARPVYQISRPCDFAGRWLTRVFLLSCRLDSCILLGESMVRTGAQVVAEGLSMESKAKEIDGIICSLGWAWSQVHQSGHHSVKVAASRSCRDGMFSCPRLDHAGGLVRDSVTDGGIDETTLWGMMRGARISYPQFLLRIIDSEDGFDLAAASLLVSVRKLRS